MNETQKFIARKFSEYYRRNPINESEIEKREFGFGGWERKIEMRHIKFSSVQELNMRLERDAPLFVSRSAAYYEFPDARPMPKKNWLGADLIFDLDAKEHSCGKFVCEECFEKVKEQTQKLIEDFLIPDFGFSEDEIEINFSGSRGYHVHVKNKEAQKLGREERREIVDYISGIGLSFDSFFREEGRKLLGPKPGDGGYGGKFAREVLRKLGEKQVFDSPFLKRFRGGESERFAEGIREGNWSKVRIPKMEERLRNIFQSLSVRLSERVDASVTYDTGKLIRLPNSLHGGSGLCAKKISALEKFEPLRDAVVFSDAPLKVRMSENVPKIMMGGMEFGGYKANEIVEVPEFFGIYLICKGSANLEA